MNTAADTMGGDLNEGRTRTPRFMNFGTVAAIIRKDMRTLWPLALGVAALSLVFEGFFQNVSDFPHAVLGSGDITLPLDGTLWVASSVGISVAIGLFVVMLVQQDRAIDPINDWMYRPIRASEIVMAKVLTILAVVMAPSILGTTLYAMIHGDELMEVVGPVCLMFTTCAFLLMLGWLSSGPFQALLAMLALGFLLFLLISISVSIAEMDVFQRVSLPAEATVSVAPTALPAPAVSGSVSMIETSTSGMSAEAVISLTVLIVLTVASTAVVLWLLLGRRQVFAARVTFLCIYIVMVLGFMTSVEVTSSPQQIGTPAATLEQRVASFAKNDANGDGKLDKAEYQKVLNELGFPDQLENFWAQRERDGDGFISLEEIKPDIGMTPPAASLEQRMDAFTAYDANKDRKLTKDEYALVLRSTGFGGLVETYWPQRDSDRDGFISLEEYLRVLPPAPARLAPPPAIPAPPPERPRPTQF